MPPSLMPSFSQFPLGTHFHLPPVPLIQVMVLSSRWNCTTLANQAFHSLTTPRIGQRYTCDLNLANEIQGEDFVQNFKWGKRRSLFCWCF